MHFKGKHFLLVVENLSVPFDRRVWREAKTLSDNGAKVSVICPMQHQSHCKYELLEKINIYRYPQSFSNGTAIGYLKEYIIAFYQTFFLILKVHKTEKIDSIHVANPPDIFWPFAIFARLFGKKFIFDEHDLTPETYISKFNGDIIRHKWMYKLQKLFQKLSYKYADAIISTNESYKQMAIKTNPRNQVKTHIVRNGPDTRYFHLKPKNNDLKKGFPFMAAYIGIMGIQDGVHYIIEAMNILVNKQNFKDVIVYLIGKGEQLDELKLLAKQYNLENYFVFTGRIPDEPALEILSTADICLSPDPYNPLNNFSTMNKVMEYMALGKPVVSFDLKEARYSAQAAAVYVENNNTTAFAQGIIQLLKDKAKCKTMSEFGMARIENELCWQIQANNLIDVYSNLFRNNSIHSNKRLITHPENCNKVRLAKKQAEFHNHVISKEK